LMSDPLRDPAVLLSWAITYLADGVVCAVNCPLSVVCCPLYLFRCAFGWHLNSASIAHWVIETSTADNTQQTTDS